MNHKRVAGGVGGAAEEDCRSGRVPGAAAGASGITGGAQERQGDRETNKSGRDYRRGGKSGRAAERGHRSGRAE